MLVETLAEQIEDRVQANHSLPPRLIVRASTAG
jgi:DNA-binding LacI/PurR family transcriptional regulator